MGNTNMEETEEQKEAKRLAREERRRQKEEAIEKEQSNRASKPKRQKLSSEDKKKVLKIVLPSIAAVVAVSIIIACISIFGGTTKKEAGGLILLGDITGYTEEDAINGLREDGFINIKREYTYDQFTQDGCVIKTDHHINSQLKPDDQITVFICDKSLINISEDENSTGNPVSADMTYFTMDGITVIDMAIKDNTFYAMLKNNNQQAIRGIQYRIGYQDSDGADIGENRYRMNAEYTVLPGEKFQINMEIRNEYAYYLYISGLTYEKVPVPDEERN